MAFIPQKKKTYDAPDKDHRVICRDAFDIEDGMRLVFQIVSIQHPVQVYFAGKNYKRTDEKFMDDLITWLGLEGAQKVLRPDGSVEYEKLKGLYADIRIEHIHNDEYEKPYSFVKEIKAPGELTNFSVAA
ncbi:MAG: hypothetical protein ABMA13_00890 [Chthoniobacteraceae bacterium]